MNPGTGFVHAVKAAVDLGVLAGQMVAVVAEGLAGNEPRGLADDLVALDHRAPPVLVLKHPLAAEEGDNMRRAILDGDVVDEGMAPIRRGAASTVVIDNFVQVGG